MTDVFRPNRKASDAEIIRLNSLGLSLSTIAKQLGCHPSTITGRLKDLNISPADTRRTFMEDVYNSLSPRQRDWLENQLGPHVAVKDFIKNLLVQQYLTDQNQGKPHAHA